MNIKKIWMVKITFLKSLYFLAGFFIVSNIGKIEAQIVIGTPDLQFTQACANESFNTFTVMFVFNPPSALDPSNQFILEMSDPDGSFSDPEIVFTSNPGAISTSPASVDFPIRDLMYVTAFVIAASYAGILVVGMAADAV